MMVVLSYGIHTTVKSSRSKCVYTTSQSILLPSRIDDLTCLKHFTHVTYTESQHRGSTFTLSLTSSQYELQEQQWKGSSVSSNLPYMLSMQLRKMASWPVKRPDS